MDSIKSLGGCHVEHPDGYGYLFDGPRERNRFFLALGVAAWDNSLSSPEATTIADAMLAESAGRVSL